MEKSIIVVIFLMITIRFGILFISILDFIFNSINYSDIIIRKKELKKILPFLGTIECIKEMRILNKEEQELAKIKFNEELKRSWREYISERKRISMINLGINSFDYLIIILIGCYYIA